MAIPYLSVEVLGLIFQSASKATLKNVRLASRQFNESAKKHLFKAFTLRNTAESAMKLQRILTSPELIRYIRVVHIIPRLGHTPGNMEHFLGWQPVVAEVQHALINLNHKPFLSTIQIDFEGCSGAKCVGRDMRTREMDAFRSDFLCLLITALTFSRNTYLRFHKLEISIQNLQSRSEHHVTDSFGFQSLLSLVGTLDLSILTVEHECSKPNERPMSLASYNFYMELPEVWLASAKNLTSLRLCADSHWGYFPLVDFRNVRFLGLKTLELGRFTFSHDWQRDWLISHLRTLKHLALVDCSLLSDAWFHGELDDDGYPTHLANEFLPAEIMTYNYHSGWSDYLTSIGESVNQLRSFSLLGKDASVDLTKEVAQILHADRYLCYDDGYYVPVANYGKFEEAQNPNSPLRNSMPFTRGPQMKERRLALARQYQEDELALRALLSKVNQRNMDVKPALRGSSHQLAWRV